MLLNVARGINLSTEHVLGLLPYKDGLHRRPRADWSVSFINSELATSDIWIQTALAATQPPDSPPAPGTPETPATPTTGRDTLGSNKGERTISPRWRRMKKLSASYKMMRKIARSVRKSSGIFQ